MDDATVSGAVDRIVLRSMEALDVGIRDAIDMDQALGQVYAAAAAQEAADAQAALARWDACAPHGDPVPPRGRALGRWLRTACGTNERVLDHVPHERPFFTSLGALVVLTAALDAFVMYLAITTAFRSTAPAVAVAAAAAWGLLMSQMERFVIASPVPPRLRQRIAAALPRIALSIGFAAIATEVLVLRVFSSEIHADLLDRGIQPSLHAQVESLDRLASGGVATTVLVALWVWFVAFFCLPVGVRYLRPLTHYDRIVAAELERIEDAFRVRAELRQRVESLRELARVEEAESRLEDVRAHREMQRRHTGHLRSLHPIHGGGGVT